MSQCEHDWLSPHQLWPLNIWHRICAKCFHEEAAPAEYVRVLAKDINGEDCPYTQEELDRMIEALESTGLYDVVGRRW